MRRNAHVISRSVPTVRTRESRSSSTRAPRSRTPGARPTPRRSWASSRSDLTPPAAGPARSERLPTASRFHFDAGDLERAHALLAQALSEEPDAPLLARGLQLLGQLSSRRSGFAEALATSLQALEAAANDQRLRAEIELDVAFYCVSLGDLPGAEPHARAAVELAEPLDDDGLIADALAVLTMVDFLLGRGLSETRMVQALALEDPLRARQLVMRPSSRPRPAAALDGPPRRSPSRRSRRFGPRRSHGGRRAQYLSSTSTSSGLSVARGSRAGRPLRRRVARDGSALLDDRVATALALELSALVPRARRPGRARPREEAVQAIRALRPARMAIRGRSGRSGRSASSSSPRRPRCSRLCARTRHEDGDCGRTGRARARSLPSGRRSRRSPSRAVSNQRKPLLEQLEQRG